MAAPFAVVSDIHANAPAFEAVLADLAARGVGRVLCLGDLVGYGPDPERCVRLARERCELVLRGNHDQAVLLEPLGFNQAARSAALWTQKRMRPGWFAGAETRRNWGCLRDAPERHAADGLLFVHGSPRDPVMEYIEEGDLTDVGFGPSEKIVRCLDLVDRACFIGHTHRPCVITADFRWLRPEEVGSWDFAAGRCIVNVGSVGQPRDGDPRACYAVVEGTVVRWHRVAYDVGGVADRIRSIPELGPLLADRLLGGR